MFFGKKLHRLVSFFLSFNLIFQAFSPVIILAQEATQSADTPIETITPSATPEPTATPSEEPAPTETITLTPTEELSPTPEPSLTPDPTATPQAEPDPAERDTPEPTATPSEATPLAETPTETPAITTDSSTNSLLASLFTDKLDYFPTDTVNLTGTGFAPVQFYTIYIASSDDPAVSHTGTVITNIEGNFTYSYTLDGNYRPNYTVEVRDEAGTVVASTTFTDTNNWVQTIDSAGVNDEPGQKDLTLLSRDIDSTNPLLIKWNWDDTSMPGNNTADACALFDTNSNGFANYSICVTWEGAQQQLSGSPKLYSCVDNRSDRCSGSTEVSITNGSSCTVSPTNNDPFSGNGNNGGADYPDDTQASCSIQLADVGGATQASLLDVCSYPSGQPNSDPSDCIIIRTDKGRLTIIKDVVPDAPNTNWDFTSTGPTNFNASITGDGSPGINSIDLGTYSITEAAGAGTSLNDYSTSWSCTKNGGAYSSGTGTTASDIVIGRSGNVEDSVICTFTNTLQQGTLLVHKVYTDQANIPVTINVLSGQTQVDSKSTTAGDASFSLNTGTYSALVASEPTGYHQQSTTCDNASVVAGQTTECTITNTHDTGTVIVHKDVVGPNDETLTDTSNNFGVSLDGSPVQTLTDGGTITFNNVLTGDHVVTESTPPTGYTLDSITNGGNIAVTTGENHVYIVNRQIAPKLTIVKDPTNNNGGNALPDDFLLTVGGNAVLSGVVNILSANTPYAINETQLPGYIFVSISGNAKCPATLRGSITLAPGDDVTCNITNDDLAPSITLRKAVVGVSVSPDLFGLSIGGTPVGSGQELAVLANTPYALNEAGLSGYNFTSITGDAKCPSVLGGTVTLNEDEHLSCIITNTAQNGNLKIVKNALGGNGEFSYSISGPTSLSRSLTTISGYGEVVIPVTAGSGYSVTESAVPGWSQTSNDCVGTLTIAPGETKTCTFNNTKYGLISGFKWNDLDGDGIWDSGETGLSGWSITLSQGTTNIETDITDGSGAFSFENLLPGTYSLAELLLSGWTQTHAPNPVTLSAGQESNGNDFLNFNYGHISGHKFSDLNRNSVWDNGEPALSGWKIWLDRPTGDNLYRTTDANGYFNFPDLGPGQYRVFEENLTGWDQTAPIGDQYVIEMISNGDFQDRDFGNFFIDPKISINKILAATTNSEILVGDTATFIITITNGGNVTLLNPVIYDTYDASFLEFIDSSPIVPTTHTDAVVDGPSDYDSDGNTTELIRDLVFELPVSLVPGGSYTLTLNFKALQITPDAPAQTYTGNVAYTSACYEQCSDGQSIQTPTDNAFVDIDTLGSVSGQKFVDTNGNRVWDNGESTLNGVTINLVNAAGAIVKTTSTSGDGSYSFDSITTGDYTICEIIPTGYAQTYPNGNACHPLTVTDDGGSFGPFNFGNQIRGSIKIIKDAKPNNAQNFAFTSPQFDSFQLDDDSNATLPNNKIISDLGSNTYTVTENALSTWKLTNLVCTGDDNSSIDLDGRTATIRLDRPGENITCTFENSKYGSIQGRKYNDLLGNGLMEVSDPFIDGWTIRLYDSNWQNPVEIVTNNTGLTGQYRFSNLLPGTYNVCEVQDGWVQTGPLLGSHPVDYQGHQANNSTAVAGLSQSQDEGAICWRATVNGNDLAWMGFGNFKLGKVSGYKWNDLNGDGAWDKENEPSLEDWTINLGEQSTTTDAEGYYEFDNLSAGSYALSEENQTNWSPTKTPNSPVTVTSGLDLTDQNFGNRGDGTITVHKDVVGTQTDLTQFAFTLNPDPNIGQVYADANGDAVFNDVPSGSYTASETAAAANYTETETTCNQSMTIANGGDELSCTVTNTRDQGTVTFEKIVDDESDVSAWNFTIDGVDGTFNSGNQVTLDTGTYTVTESGSADYTPFSASGICGELDGSSATLTVTKDGGTCTFTNLVNKGTITVTKVTNPAESEESFDFDLGGKSSGATTLSDGESDSFENLFPGNYSLSENTPDGWDLTTSCVDEEQNSVDPDEINLDPGETITCTFTNTKHGTITIVKDTQPDDDQAFRFTGDLGQFTLTDSGGEESSNSQTFEKSAGEYSVTEPAIRGWDLSSISCTNEQNVNINNRNVVINLQPGESLTCTFTNTYVPPKLNLSKTNDALTDRTPGGSVTFTLTLSVLDNDVTGAKVIDLPAKGFTYRPGSWQVKINGLPVDTIAEPQYHSPGKWNLGDLLAGDIVELSYVADIDSAQTPGLYDDLAWANGQGLGGVITAKGSDGAFVGSDVNVIKDNQDTPTREVEKKEIVEGQVLGATTLPATGADTTWLYLALILGLLGTTSVSAGIILKRKHE